MHKQKLKKLPKFKNEDEEREFWATHSSADYFDWSTAVEVEFPNLKPSTESISLRLSRSVLSDVKRIANKNDIPYQSLIKLMIADKVNEILAGNEKLLKHI